MKLTILNIEPLDIFPALSSVCGQLNIFEFIGHITGPGNALLNNVDLGTLLRPRVLLVQLEGVIEDRLGNQAAWGRWQIVVQWGVTLARRWVHSHVELLVRPEVAHLDNWIAVRQVFQLQVAARQLRIVSRLDISPMVLVEVVQLVVNVNWPLDLTVDRLEVDDAVLLVLHVLEALLVIPLVQLHNSIAHDLEDNSDGEEDHTEHTEGQHGTHGSWHRSPSWQGLLLELGLLKFFNFLSYPLFLIR